jgi:multidrug efflux pump subunit AcrB
LSANQWYIKSLRYVVHYAVVALIAYAGLVYLAYGMFRIVPAGFIPTQDQGYLIVNVQMPDASSIERTDEVMTQLANLAMRTEGILLSMCRAQTVVIPHNRHMGTIRMIAVEGAKLSYSAECVSHTNSMQSGNIRNARPRRLKSGVKNSRDD